MPARLIFIVGPTAIGKTRLAIRLAAKINGEIVSCDSMQVYRGMRILSQAPSTKERFGIRHHLVGVIPPSTEYNVADFRREAESAIRLILKRGKTPILVGGSGLYVKALVDGLFSSPGEDSYFRKKMSDFAERYGRKRLHKRLLRIDPASAENIHPNDLRRVIRALEINHLTGKTMTQLKPATFGLKDVYDIKIFGLTRSDRGRIYSDIENRIDEMASEGVLGEVRRLMSKRLSKTAAKALGFEELSDHIKKELPLAEAIARVKIKTRRFAKRQLSWFRADPRIEWFDLDKTAENNIIRMITRDFGI